MLGEVGSSARFSTYIIIPKERALLADTDGPTFDLYPMGSLEKQYTRESSSLSIPIELKVDVQDSDLPHTVIARWKNVSAETWTETKMLTEMMLSDTSFRMTVHLFDYIFDANHTFAAWDIQFVANDSLGNWGESEDFRLSISVADNIGAEVQRVLSFWGGIVTIMVTAVVIISFPVVLIKKLN